MTVESRISLLTFCLAILLHLLVIVGMARFPSRVRQVTPASVTQTLVRLQRPALKPARLPALSAPSPELTPVADIRRPVSEPRQTPPTPQLMPRPQTTQVAKPKPVAKRRAKPRPQPRPKSARVRPVPQPKPSPSSPAPPVSEPVRETLRPQEKQAALPVAPSVSTPAPPAPTPTRTLDKSALLQSYLGLVAAELERHKRYPVSARRRALSGRVVLQFTISADGRVSDPQIIDSEGHAVFRTASLRTLKRVKAMPPFPTELQREPLQVTVPMVYTLKSNR